MERETWQTLPVVWAQLGAGGLTWRFWTSIALVVLLGLALWSLWERGRKGWAWYLASLSIAGLFASVYWIFTWRVWRSARRAPIKRTDRRVAWTAERRVR